MGCLLAVNESGEEAKEGGAGGIICGGEGCGHVVTSGEFGGVGGDEVFAAEEEAFYFFPVLIGGFRRVIAAGFFTTCFFYYGVGVGGIDVAVKLQPVADGGAGLVDDADALDFVVGTAGMIVKDGFGSINGGVFGCDVGGGVECIEGYEGGLIISAGLPCSTADFEESILGVMVVGCHGKVFFVCEM